MLLLYSINTTLFLSLSPIFCVYHHSLEIWKVQLQVTILKRGNKPITRQLHHFDGKFCSVSDVKVHIMEELGDEVPSTILFDVGYYEKHSNKYWLVTAEDLHVLYAGIKLDDITK